MPQPALTKAQQRRLEKLAREARRTHLKPCCDSSSGTDSSSAKKT